MVSAGHQPHVNSQHRPHNLTPTVHAPIAHSHLSRDNLGLLATAEPVTHDFLPKLFRVTGVFLDDRGCGFYIFLSFCVSIYSRKDHCCLWHRSADENTKKDDSS